MKDIIRIGDNFDASVGRIAAQMEALDVLGRFNMVCRDKYGNIKWDVDYDNLITDLGKNYMLNAALDGATIVGPFMGLISAVSYTTGPAAGDTSASHGGWLEAGSANAPTYTAPRKTCVFLAAATKSKTLSAGLVFAITAGTNVVVKGSAIWLGSGAVSTIASTAGVLYAAGVFSGGDKTVSSGETLTVSYTNTIT